MGFAGPAPMFGSGPPPFPGMHPRFPPAPGMFPPNAFAPPMLGLQQGYGMGCAPTQFPMQYVLMHQQGVALPPPPAPAKLQHTMC